MPARTLSILAVALTFVAPLARAEELPPLPEIKLRGMKLRFAPIVAMQFEKSGGLSVRPKFSAQGSLGLGSDWGLSLNFDASSLADAGSPESVALQSVLDQGNFGLSIFFQYRPWSGEYNGFELNFGGQVCGGKVAPRAADDPEDQGPVPIGIGGVFIGARFWYEAFYIAIRSGVSGTLNDATDPVSQALDGHAWMFRATGTIALVREDVPEDRTATYIDLVAPMTGAAPSVEVANPPNQSEPEKKPPATLYLNIIAGTDYLGTWVYTAGLSYSFSPAF